MAPVLARDVTRRDAGTAKTFSIVFAVIAFLVVAACILWGYYIPKWRQKYGRPSSTRFNCTGGAAQYGSNTPPRAPKYVKRFPNHPGVRGLHKTASLPIYNPRTETPFLNRPRSGEVVCLRDLTPTPTTQRRESSTLKRPTHDYELPKTPGTISQLALTASLGDHSIDDDEESGTARLVTAPVARSAGRAPPLTKRLDLFPTPRSNSIKRFDTLAHPNLLFKKLDKLDPRNVPLAPDEPYLSRSTFVPKTKGVRDNSGKVFKNNVDNFSSEPAVISEAEVGFGLSSEHLQPKDIIEAAIAVPKPSYRLKPKTPIESIRNRYDRYAGGVKFIPPRNASLHRRLTPSTEPLTASASNESEFVALTTPPTSPPPIVNKPGLVPTPLRVRRVAARAPSASPTPVQASVRHIPPSESSMTLSPGKLAPFSLQRSLESKRAAQKSIGFYRPRSNTGAMVARPKLLHIKRISGKGSSVYSRDTKGTSILRSSSVAPTVNAEGGKSPPCDGPSLRRANSMDLVRTKIDEWDLHTGDLVLPVTTTLDRPQSDVSPRSPPLGVDADHPAPLGSHPPQDASTGLGPAMPTPKIFVGRPSDDVFGDAGSVPGSGRVLRKVLDMEMANTGSSMSSYYGRTAPGGAAWI